MRRLPTQRLPGATVALISLFVLSAGCMEVHGDVDIQDPSEPARVAIRSKPVVVPEGQKLKGDLVVIGGRAQVDGEVDGSLVVVAGHLQVGPKAKITRELVSVGNETSSVAPGAQIKGARVNVNQVGVRYLVGNVLWGFDNIPAVAITGGVGLLLLMVLAWLLIVRRYDGARFHATVDAHPVRAGIAGFFVLAGLHVLIVLAFLSRYGIGLVPVFALTEVVLGFLGWVTVAGHVGRLVARKAGWDIGPLLYGLLGVGIGLLVVFVPVAGQLAWILAAWIGVGALIAPVAISDSPSHSGPVPEPFAPEPSPSPAPSPSQPTATSSL